MRSVGDLVRAEQREEMRALSPAERVALALGARDLATFCAAHDPPLSIADATRLLQRRQQAGRRPCRCIEELIG